MPPAQKVLALDLSSVVGWCVGRLGAANPDAFGDWPLPKRCSEGERFAAFQERLCAAIEQLAPEQLVLEAPLPLPALKKSTPKVVAQQLTLRGVALMEAWYADVAITEIAVDRVRRGMLGRSRFPKGTVKDQVIRFCHARGWRVADDNAADACLLWAWHAQGAKARRSDLLSNIEDRR